MDTRRKKDWIKLIHTAKGCIGLDEEAYRAILSGCAGVSSSTELATWRQFEAVMAAFRKLGFDPIAGMRKVDEGRRAAGHISAKQERYIRGLWALASRKKDEQSLRAMCRRITGADDVSFCPKASATKLILALRKITEDAGFNPDRKE